MQDLYISGFGAFIQKILYEALKFKVYVIDQVSCTQYAPMENKLENILSTYVQLITSHESSDIPLILINGFRYPQPVPEIDAALIARGDPNLQESLVLALGLFNHRGSPNKIDICPEFVKKDGRFSKEEYSIQLDSGKGGVHVYIGNKRLLGPGDCISTSDFSKSMGFIYDAPYSFVLHHKDTPVAVLSFEAQLDAILVVQIQGAHGMQHALAPLKWERLLLNIACKWATENKVHEVQVLPHNMNVWEKVRKDGKLRYDVTAKRSGFRYDLSKNVYIKCLTNCKTSKQNSETISKTHDEIAVQ